MWRLLAFLVTVVAVIGCMVENPEEQLRVIGAYIIKAYEYSKDKIEGNQSQISAAAIPIGTSVGWLLAYIFFFRRSNKPAIESTPEKKDIPDATPITTADRAQARILYNQLKQDLSIAEGRAKWLPDEIAMLQKSLDDANTERIHFHNVLAQKESKVKSLEEKLSKLLKEYKDSDKEIAAINEELKKLQNIV